MKGLQVLNMQLLPCVPTGAEGSGVGHLQVLRQIQ